MKISFLYITFFLILLAANFCKGQEIDTLKVKEDTVRIDQANNPNANFLAVEREPSFPGGFSKLFNYIHNNLKYPKKAKEQNVQGNVNIAFTILKDGRVSDVYVVESLSPETDAEAVRLMKKCPVWLPGIQNGRAVEVKFKLLIPFKIDS